MKIVGQNRITIFIIEFFLEHRQIYNSSARKISGFVKYINTYFKLFICFFRIFIELIE